MNILKFLIFIGVVFSNFNYANAAQIPYCSKKITRGCVRRQPGQTAKFYSTPKYDKAHSIAHASAHHKSRKLTKKVRSTASALKPKLKKSKKRK